jgi:signal transduction histidine kinase
MNLLSNAIKYTIHGGSIEFNITMIGEKIDFEIVDNGIGIPEKDQTYLFEPFHRGENVGEIQGTGLGMSIVKRSVEMHKGTISFESKLNKGTKFKIGIPTN